VRERRASVERNELRGTPRTVVAGTPGSLGGDTVSTGRSGLLISRSSWGLAAQAIDGVDAA
jgi:hypothetical protein